MLQGNTARPRAPGLTMAALGPDEVLHALIGAGDATAKAMITAVPGDPADRTVTPPAVWSGFVYDPAVPLKLTPHNLYACASLIRPNGDGGYHRKAENAVPVAVVLDDLGPAGKVDLRRVNDVLKPSAIIETSPRNCQVVLRLKGTPSVDEVRRLYGALKRAELTDPGAADPVRWFRLPGAMNRKASVVQTHGTPWAVRLRQWAPEQAYTVAEIATAFGLDLSEPVALATAPTEPVDLERVAEALEYVHPGTNRDAWLRVGMALHHATGGSDEGLDLWEAWSCGELHDEEPPDNYEPGGTAIAWRSFGKPRARQVTINSLFRIARDAGWVGVWTDPDAFAGLEEAGREEDDPLLNPERPLLRQPMPLWASDRLAVQIRANAKEGYSEPTHATLLEALAQRNVLTVNAPTGSGKTSKLVINADNALTEDHARKLVFLGVPTRKARQHLVKKLNAVLAKKPWSSERLAEAKKRTVVLLSGQKVPPLLNPKTGESAYRVVIFTHAMITQRGDDPADEGRLITMIDHARETELRLGLPPLEITVLLDEGDAFVTSQEKSIPLESRVREGADPKTEEVGPGRTRICIKNCQVCHHHPAETNAKTVFNEDGLPLFRFIPEPTSQRSLKVSTQEIVDAMANDSVCLHGTAIHPLIRDQLPADRDVSRFVMGDPDAGTRDRYLPCSEGILIDMARAAFATVRYTFPRDKTTRERLRPEETEGREVLWPKRPCYVRTLVTWDARPLERLRDLIGADGHLTLLSATWTADALTLLHNLFEGRSHAVVAHPEEHKMAGVLVITVPTLPMTKERIAPFVKVAPVFATLPRTEHVRQHSKQIMDWGGGDIVPAIWQDGYRDRDDADFPNFLLAHSRAPISRGADLGRYKIVMVHNGVHSALMDTLGASVNLDELLDAVEANRRSLVVQVVGRIMRRAKLKDSEEPDLSDPILRVIIYIGEEDPITHEWIDNGAWLVDRLKNQIKDRNVHHLILQLNPNRAPEAARQFLAGEAVTVTDQMEGNSARMTARVRALTAEARKEGREARSLARREATRERKRKELDTLAREREAPVTWIAARRQLNLDKYFKGDDLNQLKNKYLKEQAEAVDGL